MMIHRVHTILVCLSVTLIGSLVSTETECSDCINIGGLFDQEILETKGAFRLAMEHYNRNASSESQVYFLVGVIRTKDAFKIARLVCRQFSSGVWAMVGSVEPDSFDTLHSYANTFQMPLVTPWFPENVARPSSGFLDYALSLRPDYHRAVIDLVHFYKWDKVIYFYDSHDGLLRLQDLFIAMQNANASFSIEAVQRISSSSQGLQALQKIEKANRWSNKYVILDSSTELAKDLIIRHVQDVHMGRRNYHYLMAGLVMDDRWETDISEFGAINVTGFRLVDDSRPFVRHFLYNWRNLNVKEYPGAGEYISARSALMYDAVRVMTEALNRFIRGNPQSVVQKSYQRTICDLKASEPKVFPYGEAIARLLRKVSIEGLTGNISFNDDGRRTHFSLDVVELLSSSETVRIGTWTDTEGLTLSSSFYPDATAKNRNFKKNRPLRITTIYEKPFIMLKDNGPQHDNMEGYIKDLTNLLALKIGFNYTMHLVKDNLYGSPDQSYQGGWNGMIGEVIRNEADFAIAPLTITSSREQFVDFTKPFMTTGISIMLRKQDRPKSPGMQFLKPFSAEVWAGTLFAATGVLITQYFLGKFATREYRRVIINNKEMLKHEMGLCNVIYRTFGTLFHQETGVNPRAYSGRVMSMTWWIYAMVLSCTYTAYIVALVLGNHVSLPVSTADELARQNVIEYGTMSGGTTSEFFSRSKISVYARMWQAMNSKSDLFTKNYQEGIEKVRTSNGLYAFLLESPMNDYANHQPPCDTVKVGEDLSLSGYGIATTLGSSWTEKLNLALLELNEEGHLVNLKNKWWNEAPICTHEPNNPDHPPQLQINDISGLFIILFVGMIGAMVTAGFEACMPKDSFEDIHIKTVETVKEATKISISGSKDLDNGGNGHQMALHCGPGHNHSAQHFHHHPHNHRGTMQTSLQSFSTPNSYSQISFASNNSQNHQGVTSQALPSSPQSTETKILEPPTPPPSSLADLPF